MNDIICWSFLHSYLLTFLHSYILTILHSYICYILTFVTFCYIVFTPPPPLLVPGILSHRPGAFPRSRRAVIGAYVDVAQAGLLRCRRLRRMYLLRGTGKLEKWNTSRACLSLIFSLFLGENYSYSMIVVVALGVRASSNG